MFHLSSYQGRTQSNLNSNLGSTLSFLIYTRQRRKINSKLKLKEENITFFIVYDYLIQIGKLWLVTLYLIL